MARKYKRKRTTSKKKLTRRTKIQIIGDFIQKVKEMVIEGERVPWAAGFVSNAVMSIHGRPYRGAYNLFTLMMHMAMGGFSDTRYVTPAFLVALGRKHDVRFEWSGQKAATLFKREQWVAREENADGDEEAEMDDENGAKVRVRYTPFSAFNVEQIEGLKPFLKPLPEIDHNLGETQTERVKTFLKIMTDAFNRPPEIEFQKVISSPSYSPAQHLIRLPYPQQYESEARFFQSVVHEFAHATGAPGELDRWDDSTERRICIGHNPGEYAVEEMTVQFATAVVLMWFGIEHDERVSADYIAGWFKAVEDNPKMLEQAIFDSKKIADYLTAGITLQDGPGLLVGLDDADTDGNAADEPAVEVNDRQLKLVA